MYGVGYLFFFFFPDIGAPTLTPVGRLEYTLPKTLADFTLPKTIADFTLEMP